MSLLVTVWIKRQGRGFGLLRWECDGGPDTAGARLRGERRCVIARARGAAKRSLLNVMLAAVANLFSHALLSPPASFSHQHAEALVLLVCYRTRMAPSCPTTHRLEGRNGGLAVIGWNIVHRDAASSLEPKIDHLRNPLVRAILRTEVDVCGPVVAKVFREGACRACRPFRRVILAGGHTGGE